MASSILECHVKLLKTLRLQYCIIMNVILGIINHILTLNIPGKYIIFRKSGITYDYKLTSITIFIPHMSKSRSYKVFHMSICQCPPKLSLFLFCHFLSLFWENSPGGGCIPHQMLHSVPPCPLHISVQTAASG